MAESLSGRDLERAKFTFSVYDFDGNEQVDVFYLGDLLRSLNVCPTQKMVEQLGGTKKKGEKKFKVDEFLTIYAQAKKEKDPGTIEDFTEILKLYDKEDNGKMRLAELNHIIQALGEKLEKEEAAEILGDCCEPEDEDGFVKYKPFLKKLMAGPYPDGD